MQRGRGNKAHSEIQEKLLKTAKTSKKFNSENLCKNSEKQPKLLHVKEP